MEILWLLASWLTPTSLFLLLNLMIGTLVITSRFGSASKKPPSSTDPSPLVERVKSINLSGFEFPQYCNPGHDLDQTSHTDHVDSTPLHLVDSADSPGPSQPAPLLRAPSLLQRVASIKLSSFYKSETVDDGNADTINKNLETKSVVVSSSKKMKKWGSEKQEAAEKETAEEVEMRRPATARYVRSMSFGEVANSVDVKAADFINWVKQQRKLQRLDSILGYK